MLPVRHIDLEGCLNLRDAGGYRTKSGGRVAWGRLYRSGELSWVGPRVAEHLVGVLGLRRVIDLRTDGEIAERGVARLPPPCDRRHHPLLETIRPHWFAPDDRRPRATALRYLEMLEDGAATLVRIVQALGETPARPTLIHCAAGRDRTGIVIGCLLDLLEVPAETIADDYGLSDAVLDDGGRAEPETMCHLLSSIREQHGGTRALLLARGSSADELDRVSSALAIAVVSEA